MYRAESWVDGWVKDQEDPRRGGGILVSIGSVKFITGSLLGLKVGVSGFGTNGKRDMIIVNKTEIQVIFNVRIMGGGKKEKREFSNIQFLGGKKVNIRRVCL